MLVVEFVGPPGAGKSTVAPLLEAALAARGWRTGNRFGLGQLASPRVVRYGRLARFYLGHPAEVHAVVRLSSAARSPTPVRLLQGVKYVSVWSYRLAGARRQGYDALILDQAVVQSAWSLMMRGSWNEETVYDAVARTILSAGGRYLLVYFDVAADVAVKRIAQRPTMESRFDHLNPAENARQLPAETARLNTLFARVVELTGANHCRVDANEAPASVSAKIEAFIDALTPRSRIPAVRVR
jgi:thymidylate kinase